MPWAQEHIDPPPAPIPLTVIGGYLGAGKTTLLNAVLRNAGGRRLGVVVNDFGELAIDADLLAGAVTSADGSLVSLPNGCVCCTLGNDLHVALRTMLDAPRPPELILIEVSGVADPTVTAAWGTVPPFEPGGIIVLADAAQVRRRADDRYVGGEVRRQLAGADLLVVTKADLVGGGELASTDSWLANVAPGIPRLVATFGALPVEVVLGHRPDQVRAVEHGGDERRADPADHGHGDHGQSDHADDYAGWSWTSPAPVEIDALRHFVDALPPAVLRMKGSVVLVDGGVATVDVVGTRREVGRAEQTAPDGGSRLVAIGTRVELDRDAIDALVATLSAP